MAGLSKQQINYILDNIHKRSKREIAKDLGIEKKLVSKYIKEGRETPFISKPAPNITPQGWTIIQIISIFLLAFIARIIYINQLNHTYFFAPFKGGFDDYIFDNWAQEILKGNWLGDGVIYIYRMPLYAYVLSAIYFIFGHSYWAVYLLQTLVGCLACILVYLIGRIYFDKPTGFVAGIITALYGPLLFYNGMLVGETLGIFLICLAFLFLGLFQRAQKIYYLFLGGLCIGLSMLIRGNILFMLPFIILWLFIFFRTNTITKLLYVFVFLIGVLLSISPIIIRNYICEKDFVPIAASGGLNFYIGNAYGADGKYRIVEGVGTNAENMLTNSIKIAEESAGKKLKPSQVSNYWVNETTKSARNHGIGYLIPLFWKKFTMLWSSYELPDIFDYYFFKAYIPILNFPFFTFLLLMPLSIIGAYLSWQKRRELSLLYIFILSYMFSLLAVFITSRYRIQIIPFLSILAAYAIVRLKDVFVENKTKIVVCGVIFVAGVIFSNINIEKINFETSYNSLGILLKRNGRIEEAVRAYNKAIEIAPMYPSPYYNLGILYRDMGQNDLATSYFKKAIEVAPDFTAARNELERIKL